LPHRIRQGAGQAVGDFGNSAGAEGNHGNAGGVSLQNHARGGFMVGGWRQQQIERRQRPVDIGDPPGEFHRQTCRLGAHLGGVAPRSFFGKQRRAVDDETAFG